MKKTIALLAAAWFVAALVPARADEKPEQAPDSINARRVLLTNALLPGTAQITLGRRGEGIAIMAASLSLRIAGLTMVALDLRSDGTEGGYGIYREDGRTYLYPPDNSGLLADTWLGNTGLLLALWGSLAATYSAHDAYLNFADPGHPGAMSLGEALAAPYRRANVLTWDVLPVLGFLTLTGLSRDELFAIGSFFRSDDVEFWGMRVSPWAGLAMNTAFTIALVHANATAEEYAYRGVQLAATGLARSSVSFGLAHLPNMLVPGVSVEDTLVQTAFAGLLGWYVGQLTLNSNYDLGKSIALHFWNNVMAFTLGYLTGQSEAEPGFAWTVNVRY